MSISHIIIGGYSQKTSDVLVPLQFQNKLISTEIGIVVIF